MYSTTPSRIALYTLLALLALSCNKKDTGETASECKGPSANAGPDQNVLLGVTVSLDGNGSETCEGQSNIYTWSFNTLPVSSALTDGNLSPNSSEASVATSFKPDVTGTYVLSLVVSDDSNTSSPDIVVIDVTTSNLPPIADCGGALNAVVNQRVVLDGTGSYDPESAELIYSWGLTSVPEGSSLNPDDIYNPAGPTPTVIPDAPGVYVTSLVVSDGMQWSDPVFCTITVASDDQLPVADAGAGSTLPPCTANDLTLNGYGSYDPEGQTLSYFWSLVAAPVGSATTDASFVDRTVPNASFNWDVPGSYTFQLEVFDGTQWGVPDVVTYTVQPSTDGTEPIANAGSDQTISNSAACSGSSYVWTCEDCPAETLSLDGSASYDVDGDSFSYFWSEATGSVDLLSPYSVFTDAVTPSVPATYRATTTTSWTVTLTVSDCGGSSDDSMLITYNCTGTR